MKLLLTPLFICCLLACDTDNTTSNNTSGKSQSPKQAAKPTLHRVETVNVENKSVSLVQTVSGTLEAITKIRLYNEESGRITRLPYHEGDSVKKGTLLVQLDNALLKTDVAKAKATKQQAKLDLSRIKKLLTKRITTDEEVAKAQTALDLASADESRQLTRLARTSIKAPIDGLITERFFEPGDLLPQQSQILTIIDPTSLRLKADLAERWIPLVQKDQNVTLHIDALGDKSFSAKVSRIHPTINTATHNGIIEIVLNPVPDDAFEGQFARAKVELTATSRLIIPVHTIHYEPEGAYVYRIIEKASKNKKDSGSNVVSNDHSNDNSNATKNNVKQTIAEKVFFEQGSQYGAVAEVLSKLQAGDKIVSRGYLGLRDGKKVIVANDNRSTPTDQAK